MSVILWFSGSRRRRSRSWCDSGHRCIRVYRGFRGVSRRGSSSRSSGGFAAAQRTEESFLRVLLLDATAVVGATTADAALAAPFPAGVAALALVAGPNADAEEQHGEDEACPRCPHEAKGVGANFGAPVMPVEGVASLDESRTMAWDLG